MSVAQPLLRTRTLRHFWPGGGHALALEDLAVARGESLFLHGPSGSGKSTLLGLLAGVLAPSSGDVLILETSFSSISAAARDRFRANHLGYIFQQFNLLPFLTPIENVLLGCAWSAERKKRAGGTRVQMAAEAQRLLSSLGLGAHVWSRARRANSVWGNSSAWLRRGHLSVGPELLLADEPTSALDASSRDAFLKLLLEECGIYGTGVVFVSHDLALARHFDRTVALASVPVES